MLEAAHEGEAVAGAKEVEVSWLTDPTTKEFDLITTEQVRRQTKATPFA